MKTERVRIVIEVTEDYPLLGATRAFMAIKESAKVISVAAPKRVCIEKSNDNGETWSRVNTNVPKQSRECERTFMTKSEALKIMEAIDDDVSKQSREFKRHFRTKNEVLKIMEPLADDDIIDINDFPMLWTIDVR